MSEFAESLELMSVTEIKQEEFDDFLQDFMFGTETVTSGLDHDPETEMCITLPTFSCKRESVKTEEKEECEEYEHDDCSASKLLITQLAC